MSPLAHKLLEMSPLAHNLLENWTPPEIGSKKSLDGSNGMWEGRQALNDLIKVVMPTQQAADEYVMGGCLIFAIALRDFLVGLGVPSTILTNRNKDHFVVRTDIEPPAVYDSYGYRGQRTKERLPMTSEANDPELPNLSDEWGLATPYTLQRVQSLVQQFEKAFQTNNWNGKVYERSEL